MSHNEHRPQRISIVCVYNDPEVRSECLDRSIEAYRGGAEVDYVPVDNTRHNFASAGAALNFGARLARSDVVAFAHQDVYVHSIDRLVAVAGALFDDGWALLGANGVAHDGENIGRIRDRVQLLGRPAPTPVDVDSVDEVLFMARRDVLLRHPLSEDSDLAWHAYAVEYSSRLRILGQRVGAIDMAVTHNSLTVNLAKLSEAHEAVGRAYPQLQPIYTTCGIIGMTQPRWRSLRVVRKHAWRLRWLRHSLLAAKIRQRVESTVVLSDIRHEIDLVPFSDDFPLCLFNVDRASDFPRFAREQLLLSRSGRPVLMNAVSTTADLLRRLEDVPARARILIMGVDLDDLHKIAGIAMRGDWVVGIHPDTVWMLAGVPSAELPAEWSRPQAVPFAFRRPRTSDERSTRAAA